MTAPGGSTRRSKADTHLLSFLVRAKMIEADDARQLEEWAVAENLPIIQALATRGILVEDQVAHAVATGLRLPLLNLGVVSFDEQVLVYVKDEVAARCVLVPVCKDGDLLVLAMANPFDKEAIRAVEFASGCPVRLTVAPRSKVLQAVEQRYRLDRSLRSLLSEIPETQGLELVRPEIPDVDLRSLAREAEGAPVVKMVNLILVDALHCQASDIHIEPGPNLVQVRYRINGVLEDVLEVPKWAQNPVLARIKVMAKLDITERRLPQDGHLRVHFEGHLVDFRISSLPTADGEKIVMRVLNSATALRALDQIGLSERDLTVLRAAIGAPEGMILVTGPTGSGKTTTLYSIIRELVSREINVVTIENPIEYQIPGIAQVEVNGKRGLTFSAALRSVLRQDPDVILVGEIRDAETAEIACQAAQTGHLVLSTLHTIDTASTITRLLELGIEHHVLASSLIGVVAQRLVRTVCPQCAEIVALPEPVRDALGLRALAGMRGKGCPACRKTGFGSRTGVYEILRISPEIQKKIEAKAAESTIRALARQQGMTLLREDAVTKLERGLTTPEEVTRIVQVEGRELRCPQCAKPIEEKFSACPYCLYELQVDCEACGARLQKGWKSCPYCGPAKAAPRESERAAVATAPIVASPPAATGNGTIDVPNVLIVDDNEEIRRLVCMTLQRGLRPVHCDEAANGFEALGKIEAAKPHLIILDVMMPGMNGFELCKRLRSKLSTALVPVIMLTALTDGESKEIGFLAGTDDFLVKPFERSDLLARVQRLLERTYGWVRPPQATVGAARP